MTTPGSTLLQDAASDSLTAVQDASTAFDSIWVNTDVPTHIPTGLEAFMLSQDKIFVVLGIVLIVWFGIAFLLFRTDNKLDKLEQALDDRVLDD